jgi:hypothetical protein
VSTGVGVVVVVAILVLLPLGAMVLARRGRDPPRDRWGLERPDPTADPGVAEFRIRRQYGLRDERRWEQVRRAVVRGDPAPDDLRPAARDYAEAMLAALDAQRRPPSWLPVTLAVVGLTVVGVMLVLRPWLGLTYLLYWAAFMLPHTGWVQRRQRGRYESALTANS